MNAGLRSDRAMKPLEWEVRWETLLAGSLGHSPHGGF